MSFEQQNNQQSVTYIIRM